MCTHAHPTQPLTTPPRAFIVYLWRTLGFGLLFSLLIQHPVQPAFSPLALIGGKTFFFFFNFNKGTFSIWFFPLPEYSLHEQKRIAGGEQSFSLYFKVIDFIMFFFELFNNAHTILIDRISLDNTENLKNCCMHASKDFLHLYKEKMCCSTVAMLMNRTCQAIS